MPRLFALMLCLPLSLSCATSAVAQSPDPVLQRFEKGVDRAVERGLNYLAKSQRRNGTFDGTRGESCGIVSLAGMAFLSVGSTPGHGPYGLHVNRCVDWVLDQQKSSGLLNHDSSDKGMYSHTIATLFLSEVSGMVDANRQKKIDKVLPRATALILSAQKLDQKGHRHAGGWRYSADSPDSDLSCSGWALMALRSGRLNGARVPDRAIEAAVEYIFRCHDRHVGSFGYQDGMNHSSTLTGAALLCLELCGHHDSESTVKAGAFLLKTHTRIDQQQFAYYGVYYAAQGMFQLGGDYWDTFAQWMYETYLPKQRRDGSWRHHRSTESDVYYTSMMLLSFTVPYRQLPIYQRDESVK